MKSILKQRARRSKTAIIAYKLFDSWRRHRRHAGGDILDTGGATHLGRPLETSVARVFAQFEDYMEYGRLTPEWFAGRRVLEVGHGDNVGVALLFLAAGARSAVCLDRFYSARDEEQQRSIYLGVRERLQTDDERRRFDEAIDLSAGVKTNPERLREIYGTGVEGSDELLNGEPFDLVYSLVVLQDIYDPAPTFDAIDRILKPGGISMHKIDLSDQGVFSGGGMNPLTFRTIGEAVYRRMAAGEGVTNRKAVNYYRGQMKRLGYDARFYVTEIIGGDSRGRLHTRRERPLAGADYTDETLAFIREIRPRLVEEFRGLPDEDLLVAGAFMVARKPAQGEGV